MLHIKLVDMKCNLRLHSFCLLTYWSLNWMADILQTTCSDTFSRKKSFCILNFVCKSLIGNMSVLVQVTGLYTKQTPTWWRHQTETFSALPVTGEFPAQTPVTRRFDVFFDLCLNKRLSKQWWGWWFETPLRSFWRHYNEAIIRSYTDPAHWYLHSSSGVKDSYKM